MSVAGPGRHLSESVQFVCEQGGWTAYDGTADPPRQLTAFELIACLRATLDGPTTINRASAGEPVVTPAHLVESGLLVAPGARSAPYDRAAWAARGWNVAFDLAVSAYNSIERVKSPRLVRSAALPGNSGEIQESYPAFPTSPPLSRAMLVKLISGAWIADPHDCFDVAIAALSVKGMDPGWYRQDGSPWPGAARMPETAELERLAPVTYGRAGYVVKALLFVLAVDSRIEQLTPTAYVRVLVRGGFLVSRIEGAASDEGLSCRANYAVAGDVGDWLGLAASGLLPIGAVALGSR